MNTAKTNECKKLNLDYIMIINKDYTEFENFIHQNQNNDKRNTEESS
jgi:hypothetical protein